jgi:hypothetical protein
LAPAVSDVLCRTDTKGGHGGSAEPERHAQLEERDDDARVEARDGAVADASTGTDASMAPEPLPKVTCLPAARRCSDSLK